MSNMIPMSVIYFSAIFWLVGGK